MADKQYNFGEGEVIDALKYEEVDGKISLTEGMLLQRLASKARLGILEVGPWKGKSTCYIASKSKVVINTIDLFTGTFGDEDTLADFLRYVKSFGFEKRVVWHKADASLIKQEFEDDAYDFIFIDGDHSYRAVMKDFYNYYPKIVNGGVMAFHDSLFCQDVNHMVIQEVYLLDKFKDFGWAGSITYATKCSNLSFFDKVKNRLNLFVRVMYVWLGTLWVLLRCVLKLKS